MSSQTKSSLDIQLEFVLHPFFITIFTQNSPRWPSRQVWSVPLSQTCGDWENSGGEWNIASADLLLMEEILHQLIGSLCIPLFTGFYTSQEVQDFFHQQYLFQMAGLLKGIY